MIFSSKIFSISKANRSSILIFILQNDFGKYFLFWTSYLQSKTDFSAKKILFRSKINMELLFAFENWFFILRFFENVKINMEQLFVVQIGTFSAWEPRCCELRETLIKHKGWGGLFDTLGPQGADLCPKEASQSLTFHSVCVKFAAMLRPWRKSINLESK